MFLNVGGIKNKLSNTDFVSFLNNFEMIGLAETWLEGRETINIPGYKIFTKNQDRKKKKGRNPGGLIFLYKENEGLEGQKIVSKIEEVLWVEIKGSGGAKWLVGVVYIPPKGSSYWRNEVMNELETEIQSLGNKYKKVIIMGDFNARTGTEQINSITEEQAGGVKENSVRVSKDLVTNKRGSELLRLGYVNNLKIVNGSTNGDELGEFTCINSRGASVVDYVLISEHQMKCIVTFKIGDYSYSDHLPLLLTMSEDAPRTKSCYKTKGKAGKYQREVYRVRGKEKDILSKLTDEEGTQVLEQVREWVRAGNLEKSTELIKQIISRACEQTKIKISGASYRRNNWFDDECRREKTTVKTQLRKFRNDESSRENYLEAKRNYKKLCMSKKKESQKQWFTELKSLAEAGNQKGFWKKIKALNKRPDPKNNITPSEWLEHFKTLFGKDITTNDDRLEKPGLQEQEDDTTSTNFDKNISLEEIREAFKKLKKGKAGGVDGFNSDVFKVLAQEEKFLDIILSYFNLIWTQESIPADWRIGLIYPIYKGKGDPNATGNYRGVVLLDIVGKMFCRILNRRIREWVDINKIMVDEQAGFRRGFSTVDNILVLNLLVERSFRKKRGKLYTCFVDFEKAFDSVNREILWKKLKALKIPPKILRILREIYKEVELKIISEEGVISESFWARKGVRQGCQLSPLLFTLFINDLVEAFENVDTHAPSISGRDIKLLLYADDIVLMSESGVGLQRGLNKLQEYCGKWELRVNTAKTKVVIFRQGGRREGNRNWFYNQEKIEVVSGFNYLGVELREIWSWKKQEERAIIQARAAMQKIKALLVKNNFVPVEWVLKIFDTIVLAILGYGIEIWGANYSKENINRVGLDCYRSILGVGKSSRREGVLYEMGRTNVSSFLDSRWLNYAVKLKAEGNEKRRLQKLCLEDSQSRGNSWGVKVMQRLKDLGMEDVWEGNLANPKIFKKDLKNILYLKERNEIVRAKMSTKSMHLVREIDRFDHTPFYVFKVGNIARSGLAWLRLGCWKGQSLRLEGERKCPLCKEKDSSWHLVGGCKETQGVRETMGINIEVWEWKHCLKIKDVVSLGKFGRYLSKVRDKRKQANEKLKI